MENPVDHTVDLGLVNYVKHPENPNYVVEARFKKPFIPFPIFRWALILFSVSVVVLAVLGYCEAQRKLESYESSIKGAVDQK